MLAAEGIEDLRKCCGGHGYVMSSGIAALEADYKGCVCVNKRVREQT
jgi:hypothetical protein